MGAIEAIRRAIGLESRHVAGDGHTVLTTSTAGEGSIVFTPMTWADSGVLPLFQINPSAVKTARDPASLWNGYRDSVIAYSCIRAIQTALADPVLRMEARDGAGQWAAVESDNEFARRDGVNYNGFLELWTSPNPAMDEVDFLTAMQTALDISGVAYAELIRAEAGNILEIWPRDPTRIEFRSDNTGRSRYVYRESAGNYRAIARENLLIRQAHPSPMSVAMPSNDLDALVIGYIRAFFDNGGIPSIVYRAVNRTLTPAQAEEVRQRIRSRVEHHGIAVVDQNGEIEALGASISDIQVEHLQGAAEARICTAFSVPPLIIYTSVGLRNATYSNMDEAWGQFWKTTMSSKMRQWRSWLTRYLLPHFVDDELVRRRQYRLNWDLSQVPALQESVDAIHERTSEAFRGGALTVDEYRESIGMGPHDDEFVGASTPWLPITATTPVVVQPRTGATTTSSSRPVTESRAMAKIDDDTARTTRELVAASLRDQYKRAGAAVAAELYGDE